MSDFIPLGFFATILIGPWLVAGCLIAVGEARLWWLRRRIPKA